MEDELIVGLFINRSQQAIVETESKYGDLCRQIVRSILNNTEDEEECVNDIYMELWKSVYLVSPTNLKAYIVTVARNQAFKKKRYKYAKKRTDKGDMRAGCDKDSINNEIEERLDEIEIEQHISEFLERYDIRKRMLFIRRFYYGDSLGYLSEKYDLTLSNVKMSLFRMRRDLRKYLNEKGFNLYE